MATYKDIQTANSTIKTVDIHNKEYAEVNQRVKAFRMVYPNGAIITEVVDNKDGLVIIKATILNEEHTVIGTGHAYEKESSSQINRTSYIENCETSAIGRALGFCGFGIDTSIASADEVKQAIHQQETMDETPTASTLKELESLNIRVVDVASYYKKSADELTETEIKTVIQKTKAKRARLGE